MTALATTHEARNAFVEKKKRKEALDVLDGEEESRQKRIEERKRQQQKVAIAKTAAKKKTAVKLAAVWFSVFVIGVFAFGWFSGDLIPWFHKLIN